MSISMSEYMHFCASPVFILVPYLLLHFSDYAVMSEPSFVLFVSCILSTVLSQPPLNSACQYSKAHGLVREVPPQVISSFLTGRSASWQWLNLSLTLTVLVCKDASATQTHNIMHDCTFNYDNKVMLLWNVYNLIWTFSPPKNKNYIFSFTFCKLLFSFFIFHNRMVWHYVSSFSVSDCTHGFSEPLPRETADDSQNNIPGHFQDFVAGR